MSVRVYDAVQAEALKRYLDETYGFCCEVEHIDLGIRSPQRKRGPRPVLSAEERKARKKLLNEAGYQRKKAA